MENRFKQVKKHKARSFYAEMMLTLNRWNILLVDDRGKIVSAPWLMKAATGALILLVVALVSGISLLFLYIGKWSESRKLEDSLQVSREQVKALQYEKDILTARLVLEGIPLTPQPSEKKDEQAAKAVEPEKSEQKPGASIREMALLYEPNSSSPQLQFIVANTNKNAGEISGYIFVILKPDESDPAKWLAIPPFNPAAERPADIAAGKYFKISGFKTIKYTLNNQKNPEQFKEATVFLFTPDGTLLLKQTSPVQVRMVEPEPPRQPVEQIQEKPASETMITPR